MAEFDLIDRNTLFEKVTNLYRYSTGDARVAYRNLLDIILDEPAADVQPKDVVSSEAIPDGSDQIGGV